MNSSEKDKRNNCSKERLMRCAEGGTLTKPRLLLGDEEGKEAIEDPGDF